MIIDFHTHSFPDALAPRAMAALKQNVSDKIPVVAHTDGTASGAKEILQEAGIDLAVVCNIATNAKQEHNVNSYAISLLEDHFFVPLGSLHPDSENIEDELDRLTSCGIKGIKLHPDYVRIPISDSRYDKLLSLISERGLFCIMHTGFDPVSPDKIHATPKMLLDTIKKHPSLTLIAAHMGGSKLASEVLNTLVGTGIYIDTSLSSLRTDERDTLYKILAEHDEDRILFGTDTPWSNPKDEIAFISNAPISNERKAKIFEMNARRLLGI